MNAEFYDACNGNQRLMDEIYSWRALQEPRDRLRYLDVATEAITNPGNRGHLIQRLYADCLKKATFDFGKIGNSRGNVTKYEHYDKLMATRDCLVELTSGSVVDSLQAFDKLHNILIECRGDFEMGYKFNIEFLQLTYRTLVLSLHQLVDMSVSEVTDYLRDALNTELSGTKIVRTQQNSIVLSNVNAFISAYEKGEWAKLMQTFKKDRQALVGVFAAVGTAAAGMTPIGWAAAIVATLLSILMIIRALIYFYYNSKTRLRDYAENEAAILKQHIMLEADKNSSAIEKQKKMLDFLEARADLNNGRNKKAEDAAQRDLANANRDAGNPTTLVNPDDEFELV